MYLRFDGKTALVTGAGKGIGRETAKALVKCGASVIGLSRTMADLDSLQKEIPEIKIVCVDMSDWEATRKAVSELGTIDLLVNNAGVYEPTPVMDITKEQIDRMFDVNVKAVFNITQVVARSMIDKSRRGAIVNVSSVVTQRGMPAASVYTATKGAVDMLTKTFAVDLGKYKIRVNGVRPTFTLTEMTKAFLTSPDFSDVYLPRHPLGRFGEIDDTVNAILFLLNDKASMIHGTSLSVDGAFAA